jgi:flagellar hook-length control protein FliK
MRTDRAAGQSPAGGEFLPEDGKSLPPFEPPKLADELQQPPDIEISAEPGSRGVEAVELRDRELSLELAVAYSAAEIPLTDASQVVLLPVDKLPAVAAGAPEFTQKPDGSVNREIALETRPPAAVEARLALAVAAQTQNATAPATQSAGNETPVLQPLAENLLRDKAPHAAPQYAKSLLVAGDEGTIKLTDTSQGERLPGERLPEFGRTISALETVQRPDTRVAATASSHSATPTNLATTISQFSSDAALSRSEMMMDTINTPVRDAAWGDKLGECLLMLSGNQLKTAELKLTPADMGPLRVRISIEEGAAHVSFHAQHAVTREAIEQALPRLREMLADSGLSLGQADVSEQGVADGKADREFVSGGNAGASGDAHDDVIDSDIVERQKTVKSNQLLDTFA